MCPGVCLFVRSLLALFEFVIISQNKNYNLIKGQCKFNKSHCLISLLALIRTERDVVRQGTWGTGVHFLFSKLHCTLHMLCVYMEYFIIKIILEWPHIETLIFSFEVWSYLSVNNKGPIGYCVVQKKYRASHMCDFKFSSSHILKSKTKQVKFILILYFI